ncbi:hypothetical protein TrCOL_g11861 [Triparma columacea]|jgi:F-type H+-transporting ATPase subunit O|uniref:ATP synthase subunit 5, mitochondrial n=1 Tax=Triparma columacea TaxID=722753 RepID=A0A9W7L5J4_9STRA|nr:hypothetical protein TrCOL_g11861 [Triparma columacea]
MLSRATSRLAVRSFAKKAAPKKAAAASSASDLAHAPPIKLFGVHARYANATYSAASASKSLPKVEAELLAIKATAEKDAAFSSFLSDPTVAPAAKEAQINTLFGSKMSDITVNLMSALAGNARLGETTKVVDCFSELMKASRGEVDAVITSAAPLSKAVADQVTAALKGKVGDKKVVLSMVVDPNIMGGLQVQIGDEFVDLSTASRIDAVSRAINGPALSEL